MTIKPFRPLLAATIDNNDQLEGLAYPLVASPKVDGIRCINHPNLGPVTRSLKLIRNDFIRNKLSTVSLTDLDGEIVSGPIAAQDVFNRTTSAVMTASGHPEFTYHVFDSSILSEGVSYIKRLEDLEPRSKAWMSAGVNYVKVLPHRIVRNSSEVLEAEIEWLALGFEGVMLRHPGARYKVGRSTLKEQILLKLKRFTDAEAKVIGFTALERNQNPQTRNSQGLAERSSHQAGKVQIETLGNLIVRDLSGRYGEFNVGSGFDVNLRDQIWNRRDWYMGKTITYKFQEVGVVEKPRFPIFLRFREAE